MRVNSITGPNATGAPCDHCYEARWPSFDFNLGDDVSGLGDDVSRICEACLLFNIVRPMHAAGYWVDRERAPDDVSSEWIEIVAALQLDRTPPRDEILARLVHGREPVPLAVRAYLNGLFTGLRG